MLLADIEMFVVVDKVACATAEQALEEGWFLLGFRFRGSLPWFPGAGCHDRRGWTGVVDGIAIVVARGSS